MSWLPVSRRGGIAPQPGTPHFLPGTHRRRQKYVTTDYPLDQPAPGPGCTWRALIETASPRAARIGTSGAGCEAFYRIPVSARNAPEANGLSVARKRRANGPSSAAMRPTVAKASAKPHLPFTPGRPARRRFNIMTCHRGSTSVENIRTSAAQRPASKAARGGVRQMLLSRRASKNCDVALRFHSRSDLRWPFSHLPPARAG